MPGDLILMIAIILLIPFALGLPLLFRPGSIIPDLIAAVLMACLIGVYIWSSGDLWIVVPILGLLVLVGWMDRRDRALTDRPLAEGRSMSRQSWFRLRLWRAANRAGLLLLAGVLLLIMTGSARPVGNLIAPVLLLSMLTTCAFRFGFYRSAERDEGAPAGAAHANFLEKAESDHASPAALG